MSKKSQLPFILFLSLLFGLPTFGGDKDAGKSQGAVLYESNCQSCHRLGRNPFNPEKKLAESSKLATQQIFKEFLSARHGMMPKFKELAQNERELKELYSFVKTLKEQSWEYPMKEPRPQDPPMKDSPPRSNPH